MNWYKKYLVAEKVQNDDNNFSWIRIDVPDKIKKIHTHVVEEFKKEDLYIEQQEGGDYSYGIEDKPHITIKFGIEFDNPEKIINVLKNEKRGNVLIDGIEIFDNENYDVLVIRCKSKELNKIHKKLTHDLKIN